jgi:hypothetical protein
MRFLLKLLESCDNRTGEEEKTNLKYSAQSPACGHRTDNPGPGTTPQRDLHHRHNVGVGWLTADSFRWNFHATEGGPCQVGLTAHRP